jgi:hypothetical protein
LERRADTRSCWRREFRGGFRASRKENHESREWKRQIRAVKGFVTGTSGRKAGNSMRCVQQHSFSTKTTCEHYLHKETWLPKRQQLSGRQNLKRSAYLNQFICRFIADGFQVGQTVGPEGGKVVLQSHGDMTAMESNSSLNDEDCRAYCRRPTSASSFVVRLAFVSTSLHQSTHS